MTDINEWVLSYATMAGPAVDLTFGTLDSGYPFSAQMEISDFSRIVVDQQHGTDDAVLMGRDLAGGFDLTFSLTTTGETITDALDAVSLFANAWRAQRVAHLPGAYASLGNNLRRRFIRGRPRNFSRKHGRMRKGVIEYVAQFQSITPEFYDYDAVNLSPVRTVDLAHTVEGDTATWPVITFTGPFTTANLQWSSGGWFPVWNIGLSQPLDIGEQITINTAPWDRTASDNGGVPRNGWVSGTRRADCFLYPGSVGSFLFTTTGATGASTACDVGFYPAYAGL